MFVKNKSISAIALFIVFSFAGSCSYANEKALATVFSEYPVSQGLCLNRVTINKELMLIELNYYSHQMSDVAKAKIAVQGVSSTLLTQLNAKAYALRAEPTFNIFEKLPNSHRVLVAASMNIDDEIVSALSGLNTSTSSIQTVLFIDQDPRDIAMKLCQRSEFNCKD